MLRSAIVDHEQETRRFFDRGASGYYAANYEHPRNRHAHNLALRRQECLALLSDVGGPILDLGCGPGAMTIPLLARGHEVTAADAAPNMIAETRALAARMGHTVTAIVADATALPFAAASFGAVVTTGMLEYIANIGTALREIARVLRPHGTLVATMTLPRRFERSAVRAVSCILRRPRPVPQYIYDRAGFDQLIEAAGLHIEARRCCTFAPFPLDAVLPSAVPFIDRRWGDTLNRSAVACDHAKTYIVRARR